MAAYYRMMLGAGSIYAFECFKGEFIGADYGIRRDLSAHLPDQWSAFNAAFVPVWMDLNPGKSKIAAGLACGSLWTVAKGIHVGDTVLASDGAGSYRAGEVMGGYYYEAEGVLPHRRSVRWHEPAIAKDALSPALRAALGAVGTVISLAPYTSEVEQLLAGKPAPSLIAADPSVEDPISFALEKHLEDFLVSNWAKTELGANYVIYTEGGEAQGQQFQTDTGPIDILAVSKDGTELLVVELKRGRASDVVVGQILRYMGFVIKELATEEQSVRGVIIALDDDKKLRRALTATSGIDFYRYSMSFKLEKT